MTTTAEWRKWNALNTKPITNADRIRAMTDEELVNVVCCPYKLCVNLNGKCNDCISSWLKQEATDD